MGGKSEDITLEVSLPYDFRIVRRGDSDNLELESLECSYDRKTKEYKGKVWKFNGFYTSIQAATKGYIRECPRKRMKGKVELNDVLKFLKEVESIAEKVTRGTYYAE